LLPIRQTDVLLMYQGHQNGQTSDLHSVCTENKLHALICKSQKQQLGLILHEDQWCVYNTLQVAITCLIKTV